MLKEHIGSTDLNTTISFSYLHKHVLNGSISSAGHLYLASCSGSQYAIFARNPYAYGVCYN
jgi:hypothetical protein